MPEGPQVHFVGRLVREFIGEPIINFDRPASADQWEDLVGEPFHFVDVEVKGKNTFILLSDGTYIHNHMLMWGNWQRFIGPNGSKRYLTGFHFKDGRELGYYGGGRFRRVSHGEVEDVKNRIGLDMLTEKPDPIIAKWMSSDKPVGELVMKQEVVSGVGNIYKSEGLFAAGIDPQSIAREVAGGRWRELVEYLQPRMYSDSFIEHSPTSTVPTELQTMSGERFFVYRRRGMPCLQCGTKIIKIEQIGRSTYFCPTCQPRRTTNV